MRDRPLRKLNDRQTAAFCSQLAMLLSAGIPLLRGLNIIAGRAQHKLVHGLDNLIAAVEEGVPFSRASGRSLPDLAASSIEAAERAGGLEDALARMARYYETRAEIRERTMASLAYPLFILFICLVILLVMVIFILPGFGSMLAELGVKPPLFISLIGRIGEFARRNALLLAAAGTAAVIGAVKLAAARPKSFELLLLRLPLINELYRQELLLEFFHSLGTLLEGGVPILEAVTLLSPAKSSAVFREVIHGIKSGLVDGKKVSEVIAASSFFTAETKQMVDVAENSGELPIMCLKIAAYLSKEKEQRLNKMAKLAEPVMTLMVGGLVAVLAGGIFMPLMSVISGLGD